MPTTLVDSGIPEDSPWATKKYNTLLLFKRGNCWGGDNILGEFWSHPCVSLILSVYHHSVLCSSLVDKEQSLSGRHKTQALRG